MAREGRSARRRAKSTNSEMKRLLTVLLYAVMCSCTRPVSYETFIRSDETVDGEYRFGLELSDSLSYDIFLFSVTDRLSGEARSVHIDVKWVSPSGSEASETVVLPLGGSEGRKELYRSAVMPPERGKWTVAVRTCGRIERLRGIGLICKENGTRQTTEVR